MTHSPKRILLTISDVTLLFMQEYKEKAYEQAVGEIVLARKEGRPEDERFWQAVAWMLGNQGSA